MRVPVWGWCIRGQSWKHTPVGGPRPEGSNWQGKRAALCDQTTRVSFFSSKKHCPIVFPQPSLGVPSNTSSGIPSAQRTRPATPLKYLVNFDLGGNLRVCCGQATGAFKKRAFSAVSLGKIQLPRKTSKTVQAWESWHSAQCS